MIYHLVLVNASNTRIANYRRFCEAGKTRPHMLNLDMPVRWNSTYDMLKQVIPDKGNLTLFVNSTYGTVVLTENDWHVAQVLFDFFEILSESTNALSGIYYPTSHLMVHQLLLIAGHLKQHERDPILKDVVLKMQNKYLKYWTEIPLLYAFAFILDPRAKLEKFGTVISLLTTAVGYDYTTYFSNVKIKLDEIFGKYNEKHAEIRRPRPASQAPPGKKRSAWDKILLAGSSSSSRGGSSDSMYSGSSGDSEFDNYLRSPTVAVQASTADEFNVLAWWQTHKQTYPVLSILARDVFTVPVSTTSSESAFSLAGRILDERRACLTPDMVRTLMMVKDMELAKRRAQHTPVNEELTAAFQNCYLDEVEVEEE